ncbi:MAG: cytochrome c biogenesis protein CcdA, partial [Gemmatimonadetes bacterium]|nr:cytochrome c biogenesis protein CcdA [Gemmatimonadota bacterium]NIR80597.1 cytochrome c biogenesis protein CcdA [Gemmatimonadota bacterium]NIT89362.1 cytochrome c biogenesis protein CcdA [Gemmatimonadota bacterium]NIU33168.1 cytochrome c biogenesis protein CcdA [Gemmatimonadota bacterium]NIV63520.1 cytochrome c biogenesis protein CcdA [Gemmatimonadota bacterium]
MQELSGTIGVTVAFGAGVLSFLSPCVLPLVPSYLSFVTGMTLEDLREGVSREVVFTHSLLFVAGFSAIFMVLGASASFLGQFFRQYEMWIARIGGVVIILLGLHLAGVFRIAPLMREKRVHLHDKPAGYLGTLGVGMAFGAGWTPCIGPILGGILTFAASREHFWSGVGLLGVYSAGLAVPFLLSSLALERFL